VTLAEIVVDQLVFVLGAPEEVLDPDAAVDVLESVVSRLSALPTEELAAVRQVAEDGQEGGPHPPPVADALRELVLLLDEVDAG
jgi:hypothetical protein